MKNKKSFFISFLLAIAISSCHKDHTPLIAPASKGVYITNEGNYGGGNGEVSFYDPVKQQATNNLFYGVNNYFLGDVVQSMYIKDSLGYIVVNNSSKVEVVKIPSFQHVTTILIPNSSPRYFLPVSDSTAYITDLYGGAIHVVNYRTGRLITNITGVAEWTEHMLMVNGTVVVEERNFADTSSTGNLVTINPVNNTVIKQYPFAGSSVDGMVSDYLNRIWLGLDADSTHNIPSSIYCLNSDMSLNKHINLAPGHVAWNLKVNGAGNEIYYFDTNGIATMSVNDSSASSAAFVPLNGRNFYGLGIDPSNGDVYVSDALDYVQPSRIYRYDKTGSLIQSFAAGIISGNFAFNE